MQIQRINGQEIHLKNNQTDLTQKQFPNYFKQNASDIFLKNQNISFGNTDGAITGGFCGYLIGTVAALAAVAAAPVSGGLSLAAVYGLTQIGCTALVSKVGDKLSDKS
ncbi:MAG: hypothetical protein MJ180_01170 [Candidatus Gastranaerophilales bacterium]|nr:hypothetical protein [Candidatus Gastranaerophilales bacterium]